MNATERIKLDKSDYFQLAIISLTCLLILSVPLEPEKITNRISEFDNKCNKKKVATIYIFEIR